MTFFLMIYCSLIALYGREGFKATSFDSHSPYSFYLYDKIQVVPLESISLHLDKISIQ